MAEYIDGFVFPIPRAHLAEYQRVATAIGSIWRSYGALDYREYVGDDMQLEGTRSFIDTTAAEDDEVVVFGWVTFASKADRDHANQQVADDPKVAALMADSCIGFDSTRMSYAGFKPLVGPGQ